MEVSSYEKDMARIASVAGELVPSGTDRWNQQSTEFDTTIQPEQQPQQHGPEHHSKHFKSVNLESKQYKS